MFQQWVYLTERIDGLVMSIQQLIKYLYLVMTVRKSKENPAGGNT